MSYPVDLVLNFVAKSWAAVNSDTWYFVSYKAVRRYSATMNGSGDAAGYRLTPRLLCRVDTIGSVLQPWRLSPQLNAANMCSTTIFDSQFGRTAATGQFRRRSRVFNVRALDPWEHFCYSDQDFPAILRSTSTDPAPRFHGSHLSTGYRLIIS